MRIEKLHIQGLKKHKDRTFNLSGATLIVGQNGAGKSTVLEAISFLFGGGIKGEKVDGRNMIALVSGENGVKVSAVVSHGDLVAEITRLREPTASGLGRSKTYVEMIKGTDDSIFRKAMSGSLYGVSHVHEWLSMKWSMLRSMIVDLGSTDIEKDIPEQIKSMLTENSANGIKQLQLKIETELKDFKREIKTLEQTLQNFILEPASPEELESLYKSQREAKAELETLRSERDKEMNQHTVVANNIQACRNNPIIRGELSVEDALERSSSSYVSGLRDLMSQFRIEMESAKELLLESKSRMTILKDRTELDGDTCPTCSQPITPELIAKLDQAINDKIAKIEFDLFVHESSVQDALAKHQKAEAEYSKASSEAYSYNRYLYELEEYGDSVDLNQQLAEIDLRVKAIDESIAKVEDLLSSNYQEIARVESILSQHRLLQSAKGQLESLKNKVVDHKSLLMTIESLVSQIARKGKTIIEERVKSYYKNQLGEPVIDVNHGKIGLKRGDDFYAGIALSGAEQDLLATAIDCAIKSLQGIPIIIMLEADSVDNKNLIETTNVLKQRLDDKALDQVIVATWSPLIDPYDWTKIEL